MRTAVRTILVTLLLMGSLSVRAQSREILATYQKHLGPLFEKVFNDPTDNQRYNANEQAVQLFFEALNQENSFQYKWDFGNKVSVLTSSDRQFRIITWPVVRDNGEYECFGFVQWWNDKEDRYDVYILNDKSDETVSPEESVLAPETWFGCVYQELIETKHEGRLYYTLLGWTGVNNLVQRQVIEPICFRQGGSKPQFGQALFRREKNQRRMVLEYARTAMVNLRYDEQFNRVTEVKRVKKNGRMVNQQVSHDEKMKMIIFDEVAPNIPGMEGLYQYYVPTGTEMAYVFVNGKWELHDNAQGRVANSKLNKDFAPLPKTEPTYKMK